VRTVPRRTTRLGPRGYCLDAGYDALRSLVAEESNYRLRLNQEAMDGALKWLKKESR